jgi:hypothetical protein
MSHTTFSFFTLVRYVVAAMDVLLFYLGSSLISLPTHCKGLVVLFVTLESCQHCTLLKFSPCCHGYILRRLDNVYFVLAFQSRFFKIMEQSSILSK